MLNNLKDILSLLNARIYLIEEALINNGSMEDCAIGDVKNYLDKMIVMLDNDESTTKVKRSQAIIRRPGMQPHLTAYFYENEQEIFDAYFGDVTIIEFPINGEFKEFDV